jgi:aryl-alcohol dehydrogenase-like predicted oxidoreductase
MAAPQSPSAFGFGTATFGREVAERDALVLLDHAFARGIRHFDTAAAYSAGKAEEIVGLWLKTRPRVRMDITLATKLLPPYTRDAIDRGVAAALHRLGVEQLDVLYLHRWDPTAETDECRAALDGWVRRGIVRGIGVSNTPLATLQSALAAQTAAGFTRFTWLQNNLNYAVRDASLTVRRACADAGVAVVTFSPLGAGFLTGKHAGGVVAGSRFAVAPGHGPIYFTPTGQARLTALLASATQFGIQPALLALAWAIHRSPPTTVLIGGRRVDQIDQAFTARDSVPPAALAALEAAHPDVD